MSRYQRPMPSRLYFGLILAFLFALCTTWAQAAVQTPATIAPVTISASWSFADDAELDDMPGLWFAGMDDQGRHAIALAWIPDSTAWWPTWRLVLASDAGLLPLDAAHPVAVPGWNNSAGIDLGTIKPMPGHTYEPQLSYDPKTGALSVSIQDITSGERLFAAGYALPQTNAKLAAASGQLGTAGKGVTIGATKTAAIYVPTSTNWQISSYEADTLVAITAANPTDTVYLQVTTPGPAPSGQYRVVHTFNGKRTELPVKPQVNGKVPFPLTDLPLGRSQLTLEYVDQGQVVYSDSINFTVGRVDVEIAAIATDRAKRSASSALRVSSASALQGLDIAVKATIAEMVWDTNAHNYAEKIHLQKTIPLATALNLPGAKNAVTLPVSLDLPVQPGLFKISLQPVVSPSVNVVSFTKEALINTYQRAEAVKPGEPFTIAVFPDTQYMSARYPYVLTRMNQWVLENADSRNIALLLQVGDITDNNTPGQWETAKASFSQLDGLLPYAFALGNHDMAPSGSVGSVAHRGESLFQNYFKAEDLVGLQGSFPPGRLDNTYHTFNIGGVDYMVVSLEFAPPDEALEWANQVVAAHPKHKVIVITHAYVGSNGLRVPQGRSMSYPMGKDTTTTMNDGEAIWYDFVRKHANIFLVLSGHIYSSAIPWNIGKGVNGNTVYEFLIDYQSEDYGGNGYMALFEFTPDNKIKVNAYSPLWDKEKKDDNRYGYTNKFEIDLNTGRISYKQ